MQRWMAAGEAVMAAHQSNTPLERRCSGGEALERGLANICKCLCNQIKITRPNVAHICVCMYTCSQPEVSPCGVSLQRIRSRSNGTNWGHSQFNNNLVLSNLLVILLVGILAVFDLVGFGCIWCVWQYACACNCVWWVFVCKQLLSLHKYICIYL